MTMVMIAKRKGCGITEEQGEDEKKKQEQKYGDDWELWCHSSLYLVMLPLVAMMTVVVGLVMVLEVMMVE